MIALKQGMNMTFRKGDHVEILPDFQDEGDADYTWVVVTDEDRGRVDIQPINHPMAIKPTYTVEVGQIRPVQAADRG